MYLLSDKVRVAAAANVHNLLENEPSWRGTKTKRPTDRLSAGHISRPKTFPLRRWLAEEADDGRGAGAGVIGS